MVGWLYNVSFIKLAAVCKGCDVTFKVIARVAVRHGRDGFIMYPLNLLLCTRFVR